MFTIDENNNMYLNRGDRITIRLTNTDSYFYIGDKLTFSIMKKDNASDIIFQKTFIVDEETQIFDLTLTPDETRLGDPIKSGSVTYWYEIEYNDIDTIIGYFTDGPKKFILYPEATY